MSDSHDRPVDPDDAQLPGFRAGDASALDALIRKHQPFVLRLVSRYVRNGSDAEDVTQLSFIRAFERRDTFRGDSSFRTWLYRIAVNLALNHIRSRPKEVSAELDDIAGFTSALETTKLVAAEMWKKVERNLFALPPKQRLVVELRLFHDLSFEEISVIADCSEDSAKTNYHHAVRTLRASLPPPE